MKDDIRELTEQDFERAIPRRQRERLLRGRIAGGGAPRRLAAPRGKKRAVVAVSHTILIAAYYILKTGGVYRELGPDHARTIQLRPPNKAVACGHFLTRLLATTAPSLS